jgi:ABC-type polysaccharide/polyol phosphate transport system ATPase subunit
MTAPTTPPTTPAAPPRAIGFEHVSKRFRLRHQRPFLAKEVFRLLTQRPAQIAEHWALNDVSFAIGRGESVGIVGRNGAGKSTLLSMIARTSYPTSGRVEVHGRVAPLLELGAGFHPELTGYENIFLNAMLLGLSRQEVAERFDAIAAYAELGAFLDTPISTYSTGMVARLGFAVVAHIEADVMLIDEILGVGDQQFQSKCRDTLLGFRASGRTIVLVSHSAESVQSLCERAIWIDKGVVRADGPVAEVLAAYSQSAS